MRANTEQQLPSFDLDLQDLLLVVIRKWWAILISVILVAGMAYGWTYMFVTPMYRASVTIYVNNSRENQEINYVTSADLSAATRLVNTYINIVTSDRVLTRVSESMDGVYSSSQLARYVHAAQVNETEIFRVTATHPNPKEAARIANAVGEVAPIVIAELIDGSSARLIDKAKVPGAPSSPNYTKNTMFGAGVGALVMVVILTINYLMDTRIKDEDELVEMFSLPVLGRIPDVAQMQGNGGAYATEKNAYVSYNLEEEKANEA